MSEPVTTNPDEWPVEPPEEEEPEDEDAESPAEEVGEAIVANAPIAEDGSDVQEVVYTPPDIDPEFRETGVVTSGEQPQKELDSV